jgi:hypothetical protein
MYYRVMPNFRLSFTAALKSTVNQAIRNEDQKRGRQLATMFEKAAIALRIKFGGDSVWKFHVRKKKEDLPRGND